MSDVESDTKVWRDIVNLVYRASGLRVRAGVLGGVTEDGGELTEVAAAHEYGAEIKRTRKDGTPYVIVIPRRSFVLQTFERKRVELGTLQAKIAQLLMTKRIDERKAMDILGIWASGAIKATITKDGTFKPLAPSTIKRKKTDKPLVDTGQLVGAVSYKIVP